MTYTPEEILSISYKGLIEQGGPSTDYYNLCLYRGPGNRKCAIGHLIPDNLYKAEFEKLTIRLLIEKFPQIPPLFGENIDLAKRIQDIHDSAYRHNEDSPEKWCEYITKEYRETAQEFNIDWSPECLTKTMP